MKDIRAILSEHEIPEEAREAIAKEVRANYKTVADWQKKADRIAELEEANAAFAEKVRALEGAGADVEALRQQVADMQAREAERERAEAEQADRERFDAAFQEAVGGREFVNGIVRDHVFQQVYGMCRQDAATSAKDALESVTAGIENAWANPQRDVRKMPSQRDVSAREAESHAVDSFLTSLFGPGKEN